MKPGLSADPIKARAGASWRITALRILALIAVVALSLFIFSIRSEARRLAAYGYPGIFLVAMLSSATVLLPAPGVAFVFAMGSVFNPVTVAAVAGAGAAIGELSGYLAGFGSQGVAEHLPMYQRVRGWMGRYGGWTVFGMAAIPNPFFDLAGLAAGALRVPLWQFILPCLAGEILKMLAFSLTGAYSIPWLVNLLP